MFFFAEKDCSVAPSEIYPQTATRRLATRQLHGACWSNMLKPPHFCPFAHSAEPATHRHTALHHCFSDTNVFLVFVFESVR